MTHSVPVTIASSLLLFSMLFPTGCGQSTQELSSNSTARRKTVQTTAEESSSSSHLKNIQDTFKHHADLARAISECNEVSLYEGLPHPHWERDLLKSELDEKETITFDGGFPFYAVPIKIRDDDAVQLKQLYCDPSSFVAFQGFKLCGGYHPDWCIVWKNGAKSCYVELCFGCDEMRTYGDDLSDNKVFVWCDVVDQAKFASILNKYHNNRPPGPLSGSQDEAPKTITPSVRPE